MELILLRVHSNNDGTYGVLTHNGLPVCKTLEESWLDNRPNVSCIPEGEYLCRRVYSRLVNGETFEVQDVEGRSYIRFHWGNTELDTKGCILVGLKFGHLRAMDDDTGVVESQPAVLRSKDGFKKFMKKLEGFDNFTLKIIWA